MAFFNRKLHSFAEEEGKFVGTPSRMATYSKKPSKWRKAGIIGLVGLVIGTSSFASFSNITIQTLQDKLQGVENLVDKYILQQDNVLSEKQMELDNALTIATELQGKLDTANSKITELEETIAQLEADGNADAGTILDLQNQLKEMTSNRDNLQTELNNALATIETLEGQVATLQEDAKEDDEYIQYLEGLVSDANESGTAHYNTIAEKLGMQGEDTGAGDTEESDPPQTETETPDTNVDTGENTGGEVGDNNFVEQAGQEDPTESQLLQLFTDATPATLDANNKTLQVNEGESYVVNDVLLVLTNNQCFYAFTAESTVPKVKYDISEKVYDAVQIKFDEANNKYFVQNPQGTKITVISDIINDLLN